MATIYEISHKRLVCFLTLMVIVFVDIWVSFGATWVIGIQGEQRMQNNQKVESLWSHCDLQPNYKSEQCDTLFSSIGGPSVDGGKYLAWRAMTVISVLTFAASAACTLLSLDCVLMTDSKQWAALAAGSFSLFSGLLLAVTAIWYSVDMTTRNIGFNGFNGGGRSALSTRVDIYNQRPGPGLIFAYIMSLAAGVIGACLIIYSNDEDCYEPDVGNAVSGLTMVPGIAAPGAYQKAQTRQRGSYESTRGISQARRPSMPMSMISGFPRQTALRKQSEAQFLSESMHGSKHSIDGIDRTPGGQLDYI
ncbi:Oidioi.mRNA.OKI2018_I69.XSR.g16850.t1.cds [Oikopleura dioica]|uniref:Oidioi.mRNA.OKI2018_I69.XSR.g16850.t1.cds n=1 Tax=Oikopleura dioica TaxID=34765 RepID=A0ABN7SLB2_OIKDI|nr:Oidioi.mRNA.OKI2018_I69.XSR.g16850.t1.cds [Oikopleura dioica]